MSTSSDISSPPTPPTSPLKVNGSNDINDAYKVKGVKLIQRADEVKKPFKETLHNLYGGLKYSINYLGSGVSMEGDDIALGANYFIESGKCDTETSSEKCKGKPRHIYVRNIPTGTIPPMNLSFYNATGCNLTGLTEGRGLVPGLVEDVYDFNPVELARGVTQSGNLGSNTCKEMTLPVGSNIYDKKQNNKRWIWETKCTSGHNTMTETTNKRLNTLIRQKNPHISNARLPGPLQFRENFVSNKDHDTVLEDMQINVILTSFVIASIAILVLIRN